jgi:hypothetical protein
VSLLIFLSPAKNKEVQHVCFFQNKVGVREPFQILNSSKCSNPEKHTAKKQCLSLGTNCNITEQAEKMFSRENMMKGWSRRR